jgi:hypothetical protein
MLVCPYIPPSWVSEDSWLHIKVQPAQASCAGPHKLASLGLGWICEPTAWSCTPAFLAPLLR